MSTSPFRLQFDFQVFSGPSRPDKSGDFPKKNRLLAVDPGCGQGRELSPHELSDDCRIAISEIFIVI